MMELDRATEASLKFDALELNSTYFLNPAHLELARARYFCKGPDGLPVEQDIDEVFRREVAYVFQNDPDHVEANRALRFRREKKVLPAGRPLAQAGTGVTNLFNCFVLPIDDTREDISRLKTRHFHIQAFGGGVGINFSKLRPKGSVCKTTQGRASGAVGFITDVGYQSSNIAQGGQRSGANMGMLEDWHPDLIEFITFKSRHNWENIRQFAQVHDEDLFAYFQWNVDHPWQTFNVSVALSDKFMSLVEKNDDSAWVFEWNGVPWRLWRFVNHTGPASGKSSPVEFLVTAPDVDTARHKALSKVPYFNAAGLELIEGPFDLSAPDIFDLLVRNAWEDGCPGVVYIDTARRYHNGEYNSPISAPNPCAEQMLSADGVCDLSSIPLVSFYIPGEGFDWQEFDSAVRSAVRSLDNMIDLNITGDEDIDRRTREERRIGLGTTSLAELLILEGLRYSSQEARDYVAVLLRRLRDVAYRESVELAKTRGPFPAFDFEGYSRSWFFATLPRDIQEDIRKHGIRNVTVLTQAPVGTTGTMIGYGQGCEPYYAMAYLRNSRVGSFMDGSPAFRAWLNHNGIDYSKYGYSLATLRQSVVVPLYFEEAHEISVEDHLAMQAVFSCYVDSSVSKTLNLPNHATVDDVRRTFLKAYRLGIKSTTIYRDGSKRQILESMSKKSTVVKHNAPRRPKELPADVNFTTFRGERWVVLIGLLDGVPYELFAAKKEAIPIPESIEEGVIVKESKQVYTFKSGEREFRDISNRIESDEHKAMTRLISTSLRHGVPADFIVGQLRKCKGTVVDISSAVARVISRYVRDEENSGIPCKECGGSTILSGGCPTCVQCGWSKCG